MDNQSFEILEEKIGHILSILDQYKHENEELRNKNRNLQEMLDEKEKQNS